MRALRVAAVALIAALIGCGSKPTPAVEEPEDTGPLSAAEKLAQTIRDGGSLWWTHNGECRQWELAAEIDDDDGLLGIARRLEESGGQKRTVTYKLSVSADGLVSAVGPSVTTTSTLGRTSTGGSAACTNQFGAASYIDDNGGVRLTSKAGDGSDKVLDERWYFTEQACQRGRGAAVTNGCAR